VEAIALGKTISSACCERAQFISLIQRAVVKKRRQACRNRLQAGKLAA
jgi:hypothetical protein